MNRSIVSVAVLAGVVAFATIARGQTEIRVPDQSVFPVSGTTFGVDSLQTVPLEHADEFLAKFSKESLGWGVWGLMKITWQDIQPRGPGNEYRWDYPETPEHPENSILKTYYYSIDNLMKAAFDQGQQVEMVFCCTSSWATEYEIELKKEAGVDVPSNSRWRNFMSPPKSWQMDRWKTVVRKLVERYDGDGDTSEPDWLRNAANPYPLILQIDICTEVESPMHWILSCTDPLDPDTITQASMTEYINTLRSASEGARDACGPGQSILVGRAPMITYDVTNDRPCLSEIGAAEVTDRIWDDPYDPLDETWVEFSTSPYYESIELALQNQDCFDVFNIHAVGKYTCVLGFVNYLRHFGDWVNPEVPNLDPAIKICADDYIISPHNGFSPNPNHDRWWLCDPIFVDSYKLVGDNTQEEPPYGYPPDAFDTHYSLQSGSNHIEDPFDRLDLGPFNWQFGYPVDPTYLSARAPFLELQAGHLVKRVIFGLMAGVEHMYIHPGIDQYYWKDRIYRHGGLIDKLGYDVARVTPPYDFNPVYWSLKPAYKQFVWLHGKLVGDAGDPVIAGEIIEEICDQDGFFPLKCAYRMERAGGKDLYVLWKDDTIFDASDWEYILQMNTSLTKAYEYRTFGMYEDQPQCIVHDNLVNGQIQLTVTNSPIIIEEVQ